jgi:hypothetical protein
MGVYSELSGASDFFFPPPLLATAASVTAPIIAQLMMDFFNMRLSLKVEFGFIIITQNYKKYFTIL